MTYDTKKWRRTRWEIICRDKFRCARCRKYSKGGRRLSVHHIIPRDEGGEEQPANLITLCPECHNLIEGRGLTSVAAIVGFEEGDGSEPVRDNLQPWQKVAARAVKPYVDPFIQVERMMVERQARREARKNKPVKRKKPKKKRVVEQPLPPGPKFELPEVIHGKTVVERGGIEWVVYENNRFPPVPTWEWFRRQYGNNT